MNIYLYYEWINVRNENIKIRLLINATVLSLIRLNEFRMDVNELEYFIWIRSVNR